MSTSRPILAASIVFLAPAALATEGFSVTPSSLSLELGGGDSVVKEICVEVPADSVVPKADVYLLADTTGSMGSVLGAVKSNSSTIVQDLYDDLGAMGVDVRIGVGNYKDFPYDVAFDHQQSLVSEASEASVLGAIGTWYASGGYDGPEGQFYALDRLAADVDPAGGSIGWRGDAKKIIVWFGDAPAHDAVCSALSGLAYDITEGGVTGDLVDGGFTVVAISTTTGYTYALDEDPKPTSYDYAGYCGPAGGTAGQGTRIAAATGGLYTSGINSTTIVSTILESVASEVGTIDSLGIEPSAELLPYIGYYDPPFTDITTKCDHTYCFDVEFLGECDDEAPLISGAIDAVADGAVVGTVDVDLEIEACCASSDGHLGTATPYNVFVMGWFTATNSDISGRVAVGENATFTNYGIASKITGGGDSISVGGNFVATNVQVYGGDAEVGGTCTTKSFGIPSGALHCKNAAVFDAGLYMGEMEDISASLADLPANGTVTTKSWGSVSLKGTSSTRNVFTLNLGALGFSPWVWNGWINSFTIDAPAGSTVIINVIGDTAPLFKNGGFTLIGASKNKIVWNFETQGWLEIKNVQVPGSVLAPMATVSFNNGAFDGTLVAWDASGTGEFHSYGFTGDVCTP